MTKNRTKASKKTTDHYNMFYCSRLTDLLRCLSCNSFASGRLPRVSSGQSPGRHCLPWRPSLGPTGPWVGPDRPSCYYSAI